MFQTERPFGLVENQVFREGGEQRNRGIELSAFGEPVLGIRVLGGVTLLDAEQTKTLNGVNDGNDAIGVPKLQANIGGEWDVPGLDGLTFTSLVVHTGKQYASADNDLRLRLGPAWIWGHAISSSWTSATLPCVPGWITPQVVTIGRLLVVSLIPTIWFSGRHALCRSAQRSTSDPRKSQIAERKGAGLNVPLLLPCPIPLSGCCEMIRCRE